MTSCYSAWNPSVEDRKGSASGGVATLLARLVLSQGGVYFGARWNPSLRRAVISYTEDTPEPFRGSLYVQADFPRETWQALEAYLEAGRKGLFVGIPCQIASLEALRSRFPGQLICVDLICHGTCAAEELSAELDYLTGGSGGEVNVSFRDGPLFRMAVWREGKRVYCRKAAQSAYLRGYLEGVTLRDACYHCRFARLERTGDITLGDFMGVEPRNASFAWPHTLEADALLRECGAILKEHPLEDRLAYRPGILEPSSSPKEREAFLRARASQPFPKAVRRALGFRMWTEPFRQAWKWIHHQAHLVKRALS